MSYIARRTCVIATDDVRRTWLLVVGVVMAATLVVGCSGEEESEDGADAGGLPVCAAMPDAFEAHVAQYRSCETDDDCHPVGGSTSCDCMLRIIHTGAAVNGEGLAYAQALNDAYLSAACDEEPELSQGACDLAPVTDAICDDGVCMPRSGPCQIDAGM